MGEGMESMYVCLLPIILQSQSIFWYFIVQKIVRTKQSVNEYNAKQSHDEVDVLTYGSKESVKFIIPYWHDVTI